MTKKNKVLKKENVSIPIEVKEGLHMCFSSGSFSAKIDGEKVTGQIAYGGDGFQVAWRDHTYSINGKDVAVALMNYIINNIPPKEKK